MIPNQYRYSFVKPIWIPIIGIGYTDLTDNPLSTIGEPYQKPFFFAFLEYILGAKKWNPPGC